MPIYVKTPTGEKIKVYVSSKDSIEYVKFKILD